MSFIDGAAYSRRLKFSLRAAIGLLTLAALPGVAQAAVTQSSITAPADPYYAIWNEQVATPNVTVSGTSNGTTGDAVDIRCYHDNGSAGTSPTLLASNILVAGDGSFSTLVPLSSLHSAGGGECRLRAVPHSTTPTSGLAVYAGPRSLVGYYDLQSAPAPVANDYDILSNELGARDQYDSLGGCGIDNTFLNDPTTFGVTHLGAWGCNDWTDQIAYSNTSQSGIEIDGEPAYTPAGAEEINYAASGLPALVVNSVSENVSTGDLTIDETDPLVYCSGNAFPATSGNCSTFVSAGVSDHRIVTQTDNGHTITLDDSYSSTNGSSQAVSLRLENDDSLASPANESYEFPGQSSFTPATAGEQVTASGGVPGTIYTENTNFNEPSTSAIRAAITYYQAPSGPFTFESPSVYAFDALNSFTVPATGSVAIRYSYSYDYTLAAVQQEVAAAENANDPPTVSITSPTPAATVTGSQVTVNGTASAGTGISTVTVNGIAATLTGTSWSAIVVLVPGENTITVTVTSQAGVTSTTTEMIDYSPPTSTTPSPAPTTTTTAGGEGVGLSTHAIDAGVSVSGSGGLVLPLVCPQTASGCDADGDLTLALSSSSSQGLYSHAVAPVKDSVLARFSGVEIQTGQSRLVSVTLTPVATRFLQTRGIRRVQVTLTINNHLTGGTDVTTTQLVWLNIAPLQVACPAAAGSLTATSIGGQLRLGMTRNRAHRVARARKAPYGFERYCLTGGRIRVAYPVASLIRHLSATQRHRVAGRVIIELTGNRHYAIQGVRAGAKLTIAAHKLHLGPGITIGRNTWYLVSGRTGAWVLKAQAGTIREIGIVDRSLARTASERRYLWSHL